MENRTKNVKISIKHHEILKLHSEKNGLKIYKILEKLIDKLVDEQPKPKKKDIYGE